VFKRLTEGRPGHRFQDRYARRRAVPCGALKKWTSMLAGVVVILVGVVLMPLPGPGLLVVFFGAALMADHALWVARLLDRGEARVRALAARFSRKPRHRAETPRTTASTGTTRDARSAATSDRRTFRPQ